MEMGERARARAGKRSGKEQHLTNNSQEKSRRNKYCRIWMRKKGAFHKRIKLYDNSVRNYVTLSFAECYLPVAIYHK